MDFATMHSTSIALSTVFRRLTYKTSICLRCFFVFPCWFSRESITTGHVVMFPRGLKQMAANSGHPWKLGGAKWISPIHGERPILHSSARPGRWCCSCMAFPRRWRCVLRWRREMASSACRCQRRAIRDPRHGWFAFGVTPT